jgi:hypothetical protein
MNEAAKFVLCKAARHENSREMEFKLHAFLTLARGRSESSVSLSDRFILSGVETLSSSP